MPNKKTIRVLLIGAGAREHAIGEALLRSSRVELFTVAQNLNPGLEGLSAAFAVRDEKDVNWITDWAKSKAIELAVIGLEDPLDVGLPDRLSAIGIPTVGPDRYAAQLEMSKLFTRELLKRHGIPGQIGYRYFNNIAEIRSYLLKSDEEFAIKPIGLTAGKGVKVMGVHLLSRDEALAYCQQIIETRIGGQAGVLLEEKLIGEEFTLQAFVDGECVLPMPLVKDYKRAFEGDEGPNTGSMGSYSQADGLLPFATANTYNEALDILRQIVIALRKEGHPYRGVLYGQFMFTTRGIKLVEINARFGDPEAINVLSTLTSDFVDACLAITQGTLRDTEVKFSNNATVCKYVVPAGYPERPEVRSPLRLDEREIRALGVQVYFAKVNKSHDYVLTTSSRAIALIGIAGTVDEAEQAVEKALAHIHGRFHVRHDIGKRALREKFVLANQTSQKDLIAPVA